MALFPLTELTDLHRRICDLHIAGMQNKQIAKDFNRTPNWVSFVINDPLGQEYILDKRAKFEADLQTAQQRVCGALNAAIDCLILTVEEVKTRFKNAKNATGGDSGDEKSNAIPNVRMTATEKACIDTIIKYSGLDPEKGLGSGRSDGAFGEDDLNRIKEGPRIIPQTPPLKGEEDDSTKGSEGEPEEAQ